MPMATNVQCSLDTNILIYAADDGEPVKQAHAQKLMRLAFEQSWSVCSQVYGEFFNAVIRRQRATRAQASVQIASWQRLLPPISSSTDAHAQALKLATTHQIQYWDALIIATCAEHGITRLYSEDLPGIKQPFGVRCIDPFKAK